MLNIAGTITEGTCLKLQPAPRATAAFTGGRINHNLSGDLAICFYLQLSLLQLESPAHSVQNVSKGELH